MIINSKHIGGGGADPVINPLTVTENGTYTAPSGVDGYSPVTVNVPQGITPTGNINITDTNVTDVTNYATAQVVDADLIAANIKKDVNILGVVGSFEGGGDYFEATYTHAVDWLTDINGNARNIFNTYAPRNGAAIVAATIDFVGNQAQGNYAAISEAAIGNGTNIGGWSKRANGTNESISSSRSMYITAGTTVIVKGWRRAE